MNDENDRRFLFSVAIVLSLGLTVIGFFCGEDMMKNNIVKFLLSMVIVCVILALFYTLFSVIPNWNKPKVSPRIVYDNILILPNDLAPYKRNVDDSEFEKIVFTNKNTKLETGAFWGYSKLVNLELPSELQEIPDYAFVGCVSLKTISIPGSITKIGKYAFYKCVKLKELKHFEQTKITEICESVFEDCEALEEIKLPSTITSIEKHAFRNCKNFSLITIPKSIKSIDKTAFVGCSMLKTVIFELSDNIELKEIPKYMDTLISCGTAIKTLKLKKETQESSMKKTKLENMLKEKYPSRTICVEIEE